MKNIAIITARGGSKRIPKKNIKYFLGKPIIAYPIEAVKESGLFDDVIVSTDDDEIAEISKKYGANIPFMRSKKNSSDFATTFDVLDEVINKLKESGKSYDNICCIYPTSPFLIAETLIQSFRNFKDGQFDSLIPVVKYDFAPQRALTIEKNDTIYWLNEKNALKRSQDLESLFHDIGQFYWLKTSIIYSEKKIVTKNTGHFEVEPITVQDIDTPEDWKVAEVKYKYINNLS